MGEDSEQQRSTSTQLAAPAQLPAPRSRCSEGPAHQGTVHSLEERLDALEYRIAQSQWEAVRTMSMPDRISYLQRVHMQSVGATLQFVNKEIGAPALRKLFE